MRLLIDLQGAQGEGRFTGAGRYAIGLTRALAASLGAPGDEVHVLLNESMAESVGRLRQVLSEFLPATRVHGFRCAGPTGPRELSSPELRTLNEAIRETAIATLQLDAVLITGAVDGDAGRAIVSWSGASAAIPTAVIVHDRPSSAGTGVDPGETFVSDRLTAALADADLLLTVSPSTSKRLCASHDIDDALVTTIGVGLEAPFLSTSARGARPEFDQQGIREPFVLYAGEFDHRCEVHTLISAFGGLDDGVRGDCQLVFAGRCSSRRHQELKSAAAAAGLGSNDLVFTGYVDEAERIALYRHCKAFVVPSASESVYLAAVEAAICGAPLLAVRNPDLIGVVDRPDQLIDAGREALGAGLLQALTDPAWSATRSGLHPEAIDYFRWESVARRAWTALQQMHKTRASVQKSNFEPDGERPRLAVLAPLPPAPNGIADYCRELLPALHRYYSIELVTDQEVIDRAWIPDSMPIRSVSWFEENGYRFERVLYHFGNSPFHQHMFGLLNRFPGVVVLHDFFLGDALNWLHTQPGHEHAFDEAIAHSHGPAGKLLVHEAGRDAAISKLPCNLSVLEAADCVIVHSEHAGELAHHWYGANIGRRHIALPFPREIRALSDRALTRAGLGIGPDDLLICSFGMIAPHKLIHVVLAAFCELPDFVRSRCSLVLVGANHPGAYGEAILEQLASPAAANVRITGHVSSDEYRYYLAAADIAVQLRGTSRGETSAAVFDALGAGVPLIVNNHASLAELPEDVVLRLPEHVDTNGLRNAFITLVGNEPQRQSMAAMGRRLVAEQHDPAIVAGRYAKTIETALVTSPRRHSERLEERAVDWAGSNRLLPVSAASIALAVAQTTVMPAKPRLFIDVTAIAATDLKTGIQRTVRALLLELLRNEPDGFRVELVRADRRRHVFRFAHRYLDRLLERPASTASSEVLDLKQGDFFLGLDLSGDTIVAMPEWFRSLSDRGVRTAFVVYDLLPVKMKEFFPSVMEHGFNLWLQAISKGADEILCISEAVANDLMEWLNEHQPLRRHPLRVGSFHLGADLGASAPTRGLPEEASLVTNAIRRRRSFLMVGTVEPRKGHEQVLAAFDLLWASGEDVSLVIVGKLGWLMDDFLQRVSAHPEFGLRLFWLQKISDEFLEAIYPICTALIAASRGEGFGLPLIEAAQHRLPVIARDLKVFREVAGEHAFYFDGLSAESLADSMRRWMELHQRGLAPTSDGVHWISWRDSARQLMDRLVNGTGYREWHFEDSLLYGEHLPAGSSKLDWEGWSSAEPTHRWSDGPLARIGFVAPAKQVPIGRLEVLIGTFKVQDVSLYLNGIELFRVVGELAEEHLKLDIPREALLPGEQNWLEFVLPGAKSPGVGDVRQLGIYLKHLCLS